MHLAKYKIDLAQTEKSLSNEYFINSFVMLSYFVHTSWIMNSSFKDWTPHLVNACKISAPGLPAPVEKGYQGFRAAHRVSPQQGNWFSPVNVE